MSLCRGRWRGGASGEWAWVAGRDLGHPQLGEGALEHPSAREEGPLGRGSGPLASQPEQVCGRQTGGHEG